MAGEELRVPGMAGRAVVSVHGQVDWGEGWVQGIGRHITKYTAVPVSTGWGRTGSSQQALSTQVS